METYGRKEITTNVREINTENVLSVLQKAYNTFIQMVRDEISFLIDYEKGKQEKTREKKYRPDIDNWCVDNIANEITEFKLSYIWGNPITLVQRGEKDTGKGNETNGIAVLNEYYQAEDISAKLQELARYVEITGVGYTYVDINRDYEDGESPFKINVLDPRWTFVVRSSAYVDRRIMMAVTFRIGDDGSIYFSCFTRDRRYEIKNCTVVTNGEKRNEWGQEQGSGEWNPFGMIPIVEWIRSYDRMGCFERQISEMDNLNLLVSDLVNQTEQNTQSVWWANNVEFPEQEVLDNEGNPTGDTEPVKPKDGDWLSTYDSADGKQAKIQPLAIDYDINGQLNNITARRALILQKCNVPQRSNVGNGATGVAMDDATGWNHAEADASKQQLIMESCKMDEVKLVLKAIKLCPNVPVNDPTTTLRYMDVIPVVVRSRGYALTEKVNTMATALSHGIYGLHALKAVNLFTDVNQVWEDSKDLIEKYQSSLFDKQETQSVESIPDRLQGDLSDQIENSPNLGGMNTKSGENDG